MWHRRAVLIAGTMLLAKTGFAQTVSTSGSSVYSGPKVTRIVVQKAQRRMYLLNGEQVLRSYKIDLGFSPVGRKTVEGDGKTPEGSYYIDRRNPDSAFYLSLGISYPNKRDISQAESTGTKPGGDIFIHGERRRRDPKGDDWTLGCISVRNRDMVEIYTMVENGTQIDLNP